MVASCCVCGIQMTRCSYSTYLLSYETPSQCTQFPICTWSTLGIEWNANLDHFRLTVAKLPSCPIIKRILALMLPKSLMSLGGFPLPSSRLKSYCNGCGSWRSVGMIQHPIQFMISGLDGDLSSTSSPQIHPSMLLLQRSLHCLHGTPWLLWCIGASICSCHLSMYDGAGWKDTSFISDL